jgi:IS30 family transposase
MSRFPRSVRRLFWSSIRDGCSVAQAAAVVGVSQHTGEGWFRHAGGMPPLSLTIKNPSRALTIIDREAIFGGLTLSWSYRRIGRAIGRPASTISRELATNRLRAYVRPAVPAGQRSGSRGQIPKTLNYSPHHAQARADLAVRRPKVSKLAVNAELRAEVQTRLKLNHSPEQIANRLREDFPDRAEMRVSHETIYQGLYVQAKGGLKRELVKHLRTGRALRKPHREADERRGRIPGMVNISERPAEVADRAVPGHWEGDLITGARNRSAIGTLVERTTRYTVLLHLPTNHTADAVQAAMAAAVTRLPTAAIKTLTWDQGSELSGHANITAATGIEIYFCDPASPWQRGTNENTNGLLRQYFPKGTDLSGYHPDYLDYVAHQLNNRPRKTLHWKTPTEAFTQLISNPPTTTVATTP